MKQCASDSERSHATHSLAVQLSEDYGTVKNWHAMGPNPLPCLVLNKYVLLNIQNEDTMRLRYGPWK